MNQHEPRSTLAKVIACFLSVPSHCLNQCWLIIIDFFGIHQMAISQKFFNIPIRKISLNNCLMKYTNISIKGKRATVFPKKNYWSAFFRLKEMVQPEKDSSCYAVDTTCISYILRHQLQEYAWYIYIKMYMFFNMRNGENSDGDSQLIIRTVNAEKMPTQHYAFSSCILLTKPGEQCEV